MSDQFLTQIVRKVFEPVDTDEYGSNWRCLSCIDGIESRKVDRREVTECIEGWADRAGTGIAIHCEGCDCQLAISAPNRVLGEAVAHLRYGTFRVA